MSHSITSTSPPRPPARPPDRPARERRPRRHRHRDRPGRPAHARARRHGRERRPPPHRHRPRLRPGLAVVGAQRLHARLRRPPAARRPARRRPRPAPRSSRSGWPSSPSPRCSAASPRPRASWSPPAPLQGVGAALAAPSVLALLTTSAPDEAARNRALALFGAVSSAGASIGLLLGGLLTDVGSWRWTLFINVPDRHRRAAARAPLRRRDPASSRPLRPRRRRHRDARRRRPSSGRSSGRPSTAGPRRAPSPASRSALPCSRVLARTEVRHPHPLVQPHLVRNRRRVGALAAMALVIGANLSMFFLVVQYVAARARLRPARRPASAFLPFSLGIFAMSRITPWLIGRLGPRDDGDDRHGGDGRRLRLAQRGSAPTAPTSARSSGRC